MKISHSIAILSTTLILTACSTNTAHDVTNTAQTTPEKETTSFPLPPTFIMSGSVTVGHEVRSFTPCGSSHQLWLDMPVDLQRKAMALTQSPYQPLYGEVIGHLETPTRTGFDADFSARLVVKQINMLTAENPERCEQPTKPTRAFGNEPSWSMAFKRGDLTFQQIGGEAKTFNVNKSQISQAQRTYRFSEGSLTLSKQLCSDGMSDSYYGWQSEASIDNKTYQGCATLSNYDPTMEWSGLYQATHTKSNGFSVQLTLNTDHTATTRYDYQDNQPSLVERGYWQQLSTNEVSVVMTRHQQQYLVSERIFTRDGYQLNATKEIVNGKSFPIANDGLTLFRSQASTSMQTSDIETSARPLKKHAIESSNQFNPDVDKALRQYFKLHKTEPDNTRYQWLTYDLNGDEKDELLVQLDWCGTGGCTLLIFENTGKENDNQWRFNSRITQVSTPILLTHTQTDGWQDMIFTTSGGGYETKQHLLSYSGVSYPVNPTVAPELISQPKADVSLFSDATTPIQHGLAL